MDQPTTTPTTASGSLDAVRLRRAELHDSIARTREALAQPVGHRGAVALHAALSELADDFAAHVEVTEGPGGLHQAILTGDLRLANAVARLTAEHATLASAIAALLVDTEPPFAGDSDVAPRCTDMLEGLVRHRQRGADLVYEAFATDLGASG